MTVAELISRLEDMDQDAEVKIAYQPNYPLEADVNDEVVQVAVSKRGGDEEVNVVYIAEGDGRNGYLPGVASKALGWR